LQDNKYNRALGDAGRTQYLAQIEANALRALQTAFQTLAAAGLPGNPTASLAPADLAPPTGLDLGQAADIGWQFASSTLDHGSGWYGGLAGWSPGFNSIGPFDGRILWGDAYYWPSYYVWGDNQWQYGYPLYISGNDYYGTWWGGGTFGLWVNGGYGWCLFRKMQCRRR